MDILGVSVLIRGLELAGADVTVPVGGYEGDYIRDHCRRNRCSVGDTSALFADLPDTDDKDKYIDGLIRNARGLLGDAPFNALRKRAYDSIRDEIREDLEEFGVTSTAGFRNRA